MKKLSEIKEKIKYVERLLLGDEDDDSDEFYSNDDSILRLTRKTLLWVIQSQPRKKKDDKSKKLEDFDVGNPLLKIIPKQPKVPVEMYTTTT